MLTINYADIHEPQIEPTAAGLVLTASNGGTSGPGGSGVIRPPQSTSASSVRSVREAQRDLPVMGDVDVLVCGGGPAGIGAATAAARTGARTLLLERYGFLGGMATGGLVIPHFDCFLNDGLNKEIIARLVERKAWGAPHWKINFDPEQFKHVSEAMVLESGSDVLYHSLAVAAIMDGDRLRGAVIDTKSGRYAVLAKVVVDCTGDGDVAARAGAAFAKGRDQDGRMQPLTMMFRLGGLSWVQTTGTDLCEKVEQAIAAHGHHYRLPFKRPWLLHTPNPDEALVQYVHVRGVDGTDVRELTRAEIDARRQVQAAVDFLRAYVPEFRNAYLIETACEIGVRETRRVLGEYVLTGDDCIEGRSFPDAIANSSFGIDIHNLDSLEQTGIKLKGAYDIPYRCLVPRTIEQLLVAGRCISGTHEAHASYRVKGPCLATGQAAGTAAALAVRHDTTPRRLNVDALRGELMRQGVRLGGIAVMDPEAAGHR